MKTLRWCATATCVLLLLALNGSMARTADHDWEKMPNGVLGRVAAFDGIGGVRIAGYVRKPAGPGPFPLVLILHGGGPTAKAVSAETPEARAKAAADEAVRASKVLGRAFHPPIPEFLAQGWAIYSIDYRTKPRYILDPLEWDDTVSAVNTARSFSFVDPKRLAMFGGSHGGHVTGRMAARTDLACAVLCAPAGLDLIALSHLAEKGTPVGGNQKLIRDLEQRTGVKMAELEKNPAAHGYSSLLTESAKVGCPILMISGKNDNSAPLPVMDAYVTKLRAEGKQADAYHPDNGPHGFYVGLPRLIPETAESTRRAVAFIKRHFSKESDIGSASLAGAPAEETAIAKEVSRLAIPAILTPKGKQPLFIVRADGVQVYKADAKLDWEFQAPSATLRDYRTGEPVGSHSKGPVWIDAKGSKLTGKVLASAPAPNPQAVPWLLLEVSNSNGGRYAKVTHIQRVDTWAGLKPAVAPANAGQSVEVPYQATYVFWGDR